MKPVNATLGWQAAFVAVSVALGDTVDDAQRSLSEADAAAARDVLRGLSAADKGTRARALALALAQIATAVDGAGVT